MIRISIPPITVDRRKQLVKQSKAEAENAKVSVRNGRRDAIEGLKKAIKPHFRGKRPKLRHDIIWIDFTFVAIIPKK